MDAKFKFQRIDVPSLWVLGRAIHEGLASIITSLDINLFGGLQTENRG
jgi:hypothetical protein